ncbi:MAG: hypothetical protein GY866_36665 [Proteobacteria bacterium]|nr:hypothetical protein [Pseudomonadota bacterium]
MEKAANPEIEARREINKVTTTLDDVALLVEKGAGKVFMDELRAKITEFIGIEQKLAGNKRRRSRRRFGKNHPRHRFRNTSGGFVGDRHRNSFDTNRYETVERRAGLRGQHRQTGRQ